MFNFIRRFNLYRKTNINNGFININWKTNIFLHSTSKIEISNGSFQFGYNINLNSNHPSFPRSLIQLGKNSKIIILGNVFIGPGSSLIVGENATVTFHGENVFAHNNLIFCYKNIQFHKYVASSWNCTFMDWDGHVFRRTDGRVAQFYRPLIIEEAVGIQMNVVIPTGVFIGKNSIISANTVLRQDVPKDSLAYSESKLRIKNGYQSGLNKD